MNLQRLVIALMLALGLAYLYASYNAIGTIVAEQSRIQQQAVSPVYKLVGDELLRPLYIAETFASSIDFTSAMDEDVLDEPVLLQRLAEMEQEIGLIFFVASEKTKKQYMSDGRTLDLIEGEVAWYFEAKARDKDFMADLGQVGDVHLFLDVKMYSADREFLGYVGVGKPVQHFLETFDVYKAQYGYDFVFANDNDEIILSSLPELVVTDAYIPTLGSLDWFDSAGGLPESYDSEIISIEDSDFLITEFAIEELGWRLLLLSPLEARQAEVTRAYVTNALSAIALILLFGGVVVFLMFAYKRSIENRAEMDVLTGLPNRTGLDRRFSRLRRNSHALLCVIILDLDHFKSINDSFGHEAGDKALKVAAQKLEEGLRPEDTVARWGGEEFVMLVPSESIGEGLAVAERARARLESEVIDTGNGRVRVTASFGVAIGAPAQETLSQILVRADEALYRAKQDGRNLVRLADTG